MQAAAKPLSDEQNTFILCFLSVMWRKVLMTVCIYCQHNDVSISSNVVLKCLKYDMMAETGICKTLKPYLVKALSDGFLMPGESKKNEDVQRAVKLFKEGYKIISKKQDEMNFIHNYAAEGFDEQSESFKEEISEILDSIPETEDFVDEFSELTIKPNHTCKL